MDANIERDAPDPTDVEVGSTTAEQLLFHLQWMGTMWQCGREEAGNESYQAAQELARQLIDEGYKIHRRQGWPHQLSRY